jgi:hypothetical protein
LQSRRWLDGRWVDHEYSDYRLGPPGTANRRPGVRRSLAEDIERSDQLDEWLGLRDCGVGIIAQLYGGMLIETQTCLHID